MPTVDDLIREDLRDFQAYSSARKEANVAAINLNANESPWETGLNRYPDQQPAKLVARLAEYFSLKAAEILVTRGSDEGIDCLLRLFCRYQKDSIIVCPPTFGMYAVSAKLQGAAIIQVPLRCEDFSIDTNAIVAQWQNTTRLVFICSPNNPTGSVVPLADIAVLCEQLSGKAMVVVDEAYIDFGSQESCTSLIKRFDNLVVLRTFSKAFGLAAARVGVLLSQTP